MHGFLLLLLGTGCSAVAVALVRTSICRSRRLYYAELPVAEPPTSGCDDSSRCRLGVFEAHGARPLGEGAMVADALGKARSESNFLMISGVSQATVTTRHRCYYGR
jgi:hypothetical protein